MLCGFLAELTEDTLVNDIDHFLFTCTLTTLVHSFEENGLDTLDEFLVSHRLVEGGEFYLTEIVFQLVVAVQHGVVIFFHNSFDRNVINYSQSIVDRVVSFTCTGRTVKNDVFTHKHDHAFHKNYSFHYITFALKTQYSFMLNCIFCTLSEQVHIMFNNEYVFVTVQKKGRA